MAVNAIKREATLAEHVASINEHAEELAAAGEWLTVASLLSKRDAMLKEIDDAEKEAALHASVHTTNRIRAMAKDAKDSIADELGKLQRGREAAQGYGVNS